MGKRDLTRYLLVRAERAVCSRELHEGGPRSDVSALSETAASDVLLEDD